ncbi:SAM-dependent methyltransferase [Sphaerisporangium sp. NPDC005289]|uniref:SAM-dependent methyltransferase n=1 Tax=Sphaerisporangium sp. NPDC005289 TaxID=3155247 RepID=UPI0033B66EB0
MNNWQLHPLTDQERADLANQPTPAGIYDYLLGGKDAKSSERVIAEQLLAINPQIRVMAKRNRAFLRRAVAAVAGEGVRQFVDIGSGLPASDNVHQVAQRVDPDVTTVYVDNDIRVGTHGRALLASDRRTHFIDHDVRHPGELLYVIHAEKLIDFSRPVGLIMSAILHFIQDDEDPEGIVDTLVSALAPGSFVVISHALDDEQLRTVAREYAAAGVSSAPVLRTAKGIERFFKGLQLEEPGLVLVDEWRPEVPGLSEGVPVLAGVGRKR